MIVLTNDTLANYFSLPNKDTTVLLLDKNPYDFISRDSDTLLVTIGDSWTWGADLTQKNNNKLHIDRLEDDTYRLENVYGGILAQKLTADFLNLGESGAGNWHIAQKLEELLKISTELKYKNIIIISIFTEIGRDFNARDDIDVDYRDWLLNNITDFKSYYGFLSFINEQISKKIDTVVSKFDDRYNIYFGTNFVDPIGYDLLEKHFLKRTWLEIICEYNNLEYVPTRCHLVFPWVIEKFDSIFDFVPDLDRVNWLTWINEITELANKRAELCKNDGKNFNQLLHPTAANHHYFANYVINQL